jgi:hypothetical protein
MAALLLLASAGCNWDAQNPLGPRPPRATSQPVPAPINLLLPQSISFQGFTGGPRALDSSGSGAKGIEVHIAAKDSFGHAAKAFGDFRFEVYAFKPNSGDPRGERLAMWEVSASDPRVNRDHWNEVHRTYEFRLGWDQPVPVGTKLVLAAVFSSPFTERLFAQHVFVAGE